VTGIQGAITAYTLVMAALMITGAKIGAMIGRKRAFAIGCVIYGLRLVHDRDRAQPVRAPVGWSFLEGVGAALILPAIVALVAGNFRPSDAGRVRARRCGGSDRGRGRAADRRLRDHVLLVALGLRRRGRDRDRDPDPRAPDRRRVRTRNGRSSTSSGAVLSATGLSLIVFASSGRRVGLDPAEGGAPAWFGISPTSGSSSAGSS
jgi:hypothetical protein